MTVQYNPGHRHANTRTEGASVLVDVTNNAASECSQGDATAASPTTFPVATGVLKVLLCHRPCLTFHVRRWTINRERWVNYNDLTSRPQWNHG